MNKNVDSEIIGLLKRKSEKQYSLNQLLKELNISKKQKATFKKVLKELVKNGPVMRLRGGRYKFESNGIKPRNSGNHQNKSNTGNINSKKRELLIAKVVRRGKSDYLVPREEGLPAMEVDSGSKIKFVNGDVVLARILKTENKSSTPLAVITRNYGKSGDIKTEIKVLNSEYSLKDRFSRKIRDQILNLPDKLHDNDIKNRVDLRNEIIFTIDGEDARDYDDAVGIRKIRNGYKLWVCVADVSHYVNYKSPLDSEALERATSTYLPQRVVPMLPEKLSNDLCSLVPNRLRLTKTAEINFDHNGNITSHKIYKSVIKSYSRLTYTWVSSILKQPGKDKSNDKKLISKLKLMYELYNKMKKIRIQKGELNFDFPETVLIRDSKGSVVDIKKSESNVAMGIIEEFMIAANSVVANHLYSKKIPSIYRIHEQPDEKSVMELIDQLKEFGIKARLNPKVKPKEIQKIMDKVKNRDDKETIHHTILRSLNKAVYSTRHVPHFGLSIDDYTHFTSPIRRYPDLVVHRILDCVLSNRKSHYELNELDKIAEHCSIREREAEKLEREFVNLECVNFMKRNVGQNFNAKVVSIHPFGLFVEVEDYFVEGFIPKSTYRGKGKKRRWFNIADRVKVQLVEADMEKRRLTFNISE